MGWEEECGSTHGCQAWQLAPKTRDGRESLPVDSTSSARILHLLERRLRGRTPRLELLQPRRAGTPDKARIAARRQRWPAKIASLRRIVDKWSRAWGCGSRGACQEPTVASPPYLPRPAASLLLVPLMSGLGRFCGVDRSANMARPAVPESRMFIHTYQHMCRLHAYLVLQDVPGTLDRYYYRRSELSGCRHQTAPRTASAGRGCSGLLSAVPQNPPNATTLPACVTTSMATGILHMYRLTPAEATNTGIAVVLGQLPPAAGSRTAPRAGFVSQLVWHGTPENASKSWKFPSGNSCSPVAVGK
jgi:hypothetical protein